MGRLGLAVIGTTALAAAVTTALVALRPHRTSPGHEAAGAEAPRNEASAEQAAAKGAVPTLYCEFTNFAVRAPLVGFYFTVEEDGPKPVYAQVFRREQDGTQDDFGGATAPRPRWSYDGSQSPAVIQSPDDETQINLYDYDPNKPGSTWFEAGLRSVRYRNLGGRCRHSQA